MSEPLILVARMRAKTVEESRLRRELLRLIAATRAEAGCLRYDLHESATEPGSFLFYEMWKGEADLDAHFQSPHLQSLLKLAPELIDGPLDLTKWTKL